MASLPVLFIEFAFLAATHVFGGPPWTVVGVVAILAQISGGIGLESLLLVTASLVWLAAAKAPGNRERCFAVTLHLAAGAALAAARHTPRAGWPGGGAVIAAFMVIRVFQQATARVLAVELVVAAAILAFVLMARPWSRKDAMREAALVVAAALLACASIRYL
ncbi:MAG: hypothetical protein ACKOHG_03945 [Planctomycetia bacterium]